MLVAPAALCAVPGLSKPLPPWWTGLRQLPRIECRFRQESESAVFGKLVRQGHLQVARGGRLRITYDSGLLLVADGTRLTQYDPDTRTAQRSSLGASLEDAPLLALLVDPARLDLSYEAQVLGPGRVRLRPRKPGLPALEVEGTGRFPKSLHWTDGTGAAQALVLLDPKVPVALDPSLFRFTLPEGARLVGER